LEATEGRARCRVGGEATQPVTSNGELGQVLDAVFAQTQQNKDTMKPMARVKRDIKERGLEQAKQRLDDRKNYRRAWTVCLFAGMSDRGLGISSFT
jgi:hypothetical protein